MFKGEYLNGKRNGKGKEFNYNEELIFDGEYLNGERNGKGKEYDGYGALRFKVNIKMAKSGMVKDMILQKMLYMN